MPIDRRAARSPRSLSDEMVVPSTITLPALGFSSPLIRQIRVDLPAPLRPMTPAMAPLAIARETPSRALTAAEALRAG